MEKNRFIAHIQFEKRYSPHTVIAYRNDLDQLYAFLLDVYSITDIKMVNHAMIRSWLVSLMDHDISSRSINRKLTTLKSYYKFLIREGIVDQNPMRKVSSPKTSKRLPVFVEKEKMDLLLDEIEFGEGFPALRDRLLIEMLYDTGMRLSELINLKEIDINFHNSTLKVLGKRNKERLIPFSVKFAGLLKTYLGERNRYLTQIRSSGQENTDSDQEVSGFTFVFITGSGRRIYPKMVYRIVNQYLSRVTTLEKRSPHILRHTFATHLLNNGAELNAVKELLGHANLSATQVYTHNTIEKLKRIYKQAHPKA
jgi:integrase/recombinase XerC